MSTPRRTKALFDARTPAVAWSGSNAPPEASYSDFSPASVSPPTYAELECEIKLLKHIVSVQDYKLKSQKDKIRHLDSAIRFFIKTVHEPLSPLKPQQTPQVFGKVRKIK